MNKTQNVGRATKGCSALSLPTDVAEREGLPGRSSSRRIGRCTRGRLPEMAGQTTCPGCYAEIPVHEGLRTWCDQCNWNVGGDAPPADEGFLARQYVRIGERHGKSVLEKLKTTPAQNLRPRWTIRKGIAFVLAASVHLLSLALFASGLFR